MGTPAVKQTISRRLFIPTLLLMLASLAALALMDEALKNPTVPWGIVSYELCAYTASCEAMVRSWSPHAQRVAALSLGVDYLFMLLYPAVIFMGLMALRRRAPRAWRPTLGWVAWSSCLAGLADALENYALAQMLLSGREAGLAWVASGCATVKFVFLLGPLSMLLLGWASWGRRVSEPA